MTTAAVSAYPTERAGYILEVPPEKPNPELLAYAFLRFQQEGMLDTIFYNQTDFGIEKYLEWAKNIAILGCFARCPILDKSPALAGLGVVQNVIKVSDFKRLEIGAFFFREYQRYGIPEAFCWQMADWCFCEAQADVIYGVTPEHNHAMIRFARRMGFVEERVRYLARWRGRPCTGVIYSMTREEWEAHRGRRS